MEVFVPTLCVLALIVVFFWVAAIDVINTECRNGKE